MKKTMELLKKAQERSTIASGHLSDKDISSEQQKKMNDFRSNNKLSAHISKKFKELASGQSKDASQSVIDRIEKNHAMVRNALKNMKNISR